MSAPAAVLVPTDSPATPQTGRSRRAWWRSPWTLVLLGILVLVFGAPLFAKCDPLTQWPDGLSSLGAPLPPSLAHWLGTDDLGRDVWSRLLYGGRMSLGIACAATLMTGAIGVGLGMASGYFGGKVDAVIMRWTEIVMAFPGLLLAIALASVLPPGPLSVILTLGLVGWTSLARLIRGAVLALREQEFIEAAYSMGAANFWVLMRHVWPNVRALAGNLLALKLADMLLLEAALGFLGLGVAPPNPTWGALIGEGKDYFHSAPWLGVPAGLAIFVTVLAVNLLAERWGQHGSSR